MRALQGVIPILATAARRRSSPARPASGPSSAASSRSPTTPASAVTLARPPRPAQPQHGRAEHGDQVVIGRVGERRGQVGDCGADRGQERRQPIGDVLRDGRVRGPVDSGLPRAPEVGVGITPRAVPTGTPSCRDFECHDRVAKGRARLSLSKVAGQGRIRNQQVAGSSPIAGFNFFSTTYRHVFPHDPLLSW